LKALKTESYIYYSNKFSLESIIFQISSLSNYMYNHPKNGYKHFGSSAQAMSYEAIANNRIVSGQVTVSQWQLIDFLYDIIINHSQQSQINISYDETLYLYMLYDCYFNKQSGKYMDKNKHRVMLAVFSFAGEQFTFQRKGQLYYSLLRERYIVEKFSKLASEKNQIDVDLIVKTQTDLNLQEFYDSFAVVCQTFTIKPSLQKTEINNMFKSNDEYKKRFLTIIQKYSIKLTDVKDAENKRQTFYSTPIIETDTGYICPNIFLLLNSLCHSEFWIVRNYFSSFEDGRKSQFITAFGEYFELYVHELFANCLTEGAYEKIEPEKTAGKKRCDWQLTLGDYVFLIEQKSSIAATAIKQQLSDVDKTVQYIKRNWEEAIEQLNETEKARNYKNAIKIILSYEQYLTSSTLNELFLLTDNTKNDGYYWLVNIDEFEKLIMLYKNDQQKFFDVIADKIKDSKDTKFNTDLNTFLINHDIVLNDYIAFLRLHDEYCSSLDK